MNLKKLATGMLFLCLAMFSTMAFAQSNTISGKVTDSKDGSGLPGISVQATTASGKKVGAATGTDGTYSISSSERITKLAFTGVGYERQEVSANGKDVVNTLLVATNTSLNEVVVVGYGTSRRKDISGSYSVVSSKNFNQVPSGGTPDQLLQGKVPGLQVTVSSGQPGAAAAVRIRGNNSIRSGTDPLYVIDGVPLDGRSARPSFGSTSGLGTLPDANPLTYLNSNDIESISILKDASASAIYGSRGANGVILITTKTGAAGAPRFEVGTSWTVGGLMTKPDVLSASQYRTELTKYGAKSDSGATINPFNTFVQHKLSQNYSVAFSGGGSENSRFRASFLASKTPGLIRKSGLDKYIANMNGSYKFLDKKLSLKFGLTAASTVEQIAPISNDAGSTGNLVSLAEQWNPTLLLSHGSSYTANPNGQINPLLLSDAYNDYSRVTTLLGNLSAGYKLTPDLEYMFFYGLNYSTGNRGQELQGIIAGTGGNADGRGLGSVGAAQLFSQTITHTLTYNKKFDDFSLTALGGYEYYLTSYKSQSSSVYGFDYNTNASNLLPIHYYDNMQDGKQANLTTNSYNDPTYDLQSYFTRVQLGFKDRYSISASFRADGSTKFGKNNRYAYFPAISGKWSISEEDFMKDNTIFNNLALRVGWGKTGNQSFVSGASQARYQYTGYSGLGVVNFPNPNLKWETVTSSNAGLDFAFFKGALTGSFDVFFKKTTDPLFPGVLAAPSPSGVLWQNLAGYVTNRGGELGLNAQIVHKTDFSWSVGGNVTYVKNEFVYPAGGQGPVVLTGALSGKGTSLTWVQAIANNQPIDVFYLRQFHGFDKNGFAVTDAAASYAGDPNPKWVVGLNTEVDFKRLALIINMHGAYDFKIYNNTVQSVTGLSFITGGSNISKTLIGTVENVANPVSASTRFLSSGNYMKLGNATIRYKVGDIGRVVKNLNFFFTGNNIFVLTKYKGFDPEVNVSKADVNGSGIPSIGIDYIGYPTVRSFTLGLNLNLGN